MTQRDRCRRVRSQWGKPMHARPISSAMTEMATHGATSYGVIVWLSPKECGLICIMRSASELDVRGRRHSAGGQARCAGGHPQTADATSGRTENQVSPFTACDAIVVVTVTPGSYSHSFRNECSSEVRCLGLSYGLRLGMSNL